MCLMRFDEPGKSLVTTLLRLGYPGKFIVHLRSSYTLYALRTQ